jgi:hypothetical protein
MKKVAEYFFKVLFKFTFFTIICFSGCKKSENPIPFPIGSFPDTVINLGDINSASDDYNLDLYKIYGNNSLIFSSNRGSSGGQFNLIQGTLSFQFDKKTGLFGVGAKIGNDPFLIKLLEKANTTGNDLGPMTLFSSTDGFDYLFLSSLNSNGNLDFYYLKNRPVFGTNLPEVLGPYPVKLLNSNSDDAYLCFDSNQDTIYFSSNRGGNFDIFYHKRPSETNIDTWFNRDFSSSFLIDSINGSSEDKCPMVFKDIMVYASDRIGGMGGFDLYYSKFIKGRWSSPVNFGPKINTESDEYRPVIGNYRDFSNQFMMFSSNRPGGKGGFDLYFTGVEFFR